MPRPRHKTKEIEAVLRLAEARGWTVQVGGAHVWGRIFCPESSRDGHILSVFSTPANPEGHAKRLRRLIDTCHHVRAEG